MRLINTRKMYWYNRSSRTVNRSNLPWSSLVKYSYDEFKSGKIIFKEFNSSIRFSLAHIVIYPGVNDFRTFYPR